MALGFRPAVADDAATIAAIYAPYVLDGTVSFETEAPDAATIAARMESSGGLYPWIVATDDAAPAVPLGYAYAGQFSPREAYRFAAETTIYLAGHAHRRGVGRRLYDVLLATLTHQGFTQAIGRIALPNDPSVALHRAAGFREAGVFDDIGWKHGEWVAVAYWQRALADAVVPPPEPRRFADTGMIGA